MKGLWNRLRKIDLNRSAALAAVFISFCALYVSIEQTRMMRLQQRVSFYPHLSLKRSYTGEGFGVVIKNSGTGLAKVNSVQLSDGETNFKDWLEFLDKMLPDSLNYGYSEIIANSINDQVITPGEEVVLFQIDWLPGVRELELKSRELIMSVCYASLLDEYWLLENDLRTPLNSACQKAPGKEFN